MEDYKNNLQTPEIREQEIMNKLKALEEKAEETVRRIEEQGEETSREMSEIEAQVNVSVKKINEICSDLDQADVKAEGELDELILKEAQDLENKDKDE